MWFAQVLLNVVLIDLVYCKSYNNSTPSAQLAKRALLPAPLSDLRARAGRRHRWLGERRCPGEDRLDLGHDDAGGRLGVFFNVCRRRWTLGVRLFARRTFTTPKIRTFTTPEFGHFPPQKKTFARRTTATPNFFSFLAHFSWFFDLQLMEDIKDGKEEVLDEVVMEHIK